MVNDILNVEKERKKFFFLENKINGHPFIYFDNAATTQKPASVIDTLCNFYKQEYASVNRAVYDTAIRATKRTEEVRQKVAYFINAKSEDEIVFVKGTTEGINLIAYTYGEKFITEGDEIVVAEMEHHSNIIPWQRLAHKKKAILKVIPINDRAEIELDEYEKMISNRTKLVCITHVANTTGTVNKVEEMVSIAHSKGAKVVVDGAQAISHVKVDVTQLDADFYVFSSHKMYGPNAVGVLYGKKEVMENIPPFITGGDMVDVVTFDKTTYQPLPLTFEAGTQATPEIIAFGAAIDYITSIGMDKIEAYEQKLLNYATEKMSLIEGVTIIGRAKDKVGIISFVVENFHPLDLGTMLSLKGIAIRTGNMCAQPLLAKYGVTSIARVSFALYNTCDEIDRFIKVLEEIIIEMT
jgi:cysteine desulfurase / selenocysteine lyase